jgi:Flp pilus assembly protein TadG
MRLRRATHAEGGSAVVEFVLVSALLTGLFLAVLQLGLALHVRSVLTAAAAEGARYGANADRTPEQGADRARALIGDALPGRYAQHVTAGEELVDGRAVVVITVSADLPLFGFVGPARVLTVRGHALEEGP